MSTKTDHKAILFKVPNSDDVLLLHLSTSNNESRLEIALVPPVWPDGKYHPKVMGTFGTDERKTMHGLARIFCDMGFEQVDDLQEHKRIVRGISLERMDRQKIDECN